MIRTQLRVYYGLRGLIGNALKHAIKRDMRSLARQSDGCVSRAFGISGTVYYAHTEEGESYWRPRNDTYKNHCL